MKTHFHSTHAIAEKDASTIKTRIMEASARVGDKFPLSEIDIVVVASDDVGFWGNAFYRNTITLIHGSGSALEANRIAPTFYHELHHLARMQAIGYGTTLGEAVISEGLAVGMEAEMEEDMSIYGEFKNEAEFKKTYSSFLQEQLSTSYSYQRWFVDRDAEVVFAGYKLGYKLITQYCDQTKNKPSELFATHAKDILNQIHFGA